MPWRLIPYQVNDAFRNMAIDEAIYSSTLKNRRSPTLRFYGWKPSAVSLGYFQDLKSEINFEQCQVSGVDVVRRLTGGKAVYHHDEVTYSLAAGISEKLFPTNIAATYEKISQCLARGLLRLGVNASLAQPESRRKKETDLASCCFSIPSGHELLVSGKKICGSAQTRGRDGFLQHGSLLLTFDPSDSASFILKHPSRKHAAVLKNSVIAVNDLMTESISPEDLCAALKRGFVEELGIEMFEGGLSPDEIELSELLLSKYKSHTWNWERKKSIGPIADVPDRTPIDPSG